MPLGSAPRSIIKLAVLISSYGHFDEVILSGKIV